MAADSPRRQRLKSDGRSIPRWVERERIDGGPSVGRPTVSPDSRTASNRIERSGRRACLTSDGSRSSRHSNTWTERHAQLSLQCPLPSGTLSSLLAHFLPSLLPPAQRHHSPLDGIQGVGKHVKLGRIVHSTGTPGITAAKSSGGGVGAGSRLGTTAGKRTKPTSCLLPRLRIQQP